MCATPQRDVYNVQVVASSLSPPGVALITAKFEAPATLTLNSRFSLQ